MSRSLVGIIVGLGLLLPQLAHAHLICRIGNLGGMPWAVVTTPGKRSEGMSLLTEGVSLLAKGKRLEGESDIKELTRCCMEGLLTAGTKVMIVDSGVMTSTVRVLEGKDKGHVGDIDTTQMVECKLPGQE